MKCGKKLLALLLTMSITLALLPGEAMAKVVEVSVTPQLTALTMEWEDGTIVDILNGGQSTMTYKSDYMFRAVFTYPEEIDHVYISSTKLGEKKYLIANYDQISNSFVTHGHFDEDPAYIPGGINVEYTPNTESLKVSATVDMDEVERWLIPGLDFYLVQEPVMETNELKAALIQLGKNVANVVVSTRQTSSSGVSDEIKEWLGVYQDLESLLSYELPGAESGESYLLYLLEPGNGEKAFTAIIRDVTGNEITKFAIEIVAGGAEEVAEEIGRINAAAQTFCDYYTIQSDTAALKDEIHARSGLTDAERAEALARADELEKDRKAFLFMTAIISGIILLAPEVGVTAKVFTAMLSGMTNMSDYFWENRMGMIRACGTVQSGFVDATEHGEGWKGLTQAGLKENGSTILQSGNYCLMEDLGYYGLRFGSTVASTGSDVPVNVTLCLHGHSVYDIYVSDGSTVHISDCQYHENSDGTVTGGSVNGYAGIYVEGGGTATINGGAEWSKVENHGRMTIYRGQFPYGASNSGGTMTIEGGLFLRATTNTGTALFNSGGAMTINGGLIAGGSERNGSGVQNTAGSTLRITGGTVSGYIGVNNNGGVVIANSGTIQATGSSTSSSSSFPTYAIQNEVGEFTIAGSQICGPIRNSSQGTLFFNRGSNVNNDPNGNRNYLLWNYGKAYVRGGSVTGIYNTGKLYMTGGTVSGLPSQYAINNADGGAIVINGGTVNGRDFQCIMNWSDLTLRGGTINGGLYGVYNHGELTVSGGRICGESSAIVNQMNAKVTISGGVVDGDLDNQSTGGGEVMVNGGIFTDYIRSTGRLEINDIESIQGGIDSSGILYINGGNLGTVSISKSRTTPETYLTGGTIAYLNRLSNGGPVVFRIVDGTDLEIKSIYLGEINATVEAGEGYSGNVVYYQSVDSEGIQMTIEEAETAIATPYRRYVRLVADGPVDKVTVTVPPTGSQIVRVAVPEGISLTGAVVVAARNQNGKLLDCTTGVLSTNGTVTFSKTVTKDGAWVLFFLSPETYVPLCPKVVVAQ